MIGNFLPEPTIFFKVFDPSTDELHQRSCQCSGYGRFKWHTNLINDLLLRFFGKILPPWYARNIINKQNKLQKKWNFYVCCTYFGSLPYSSVADSQSCVGCQYAYTRMYDLSFTYDYQKKMFMALQVICLKLSWHSFISVMSSLKILQHKCMQVTNFTAATYSSGRQ